MTKYMLQERLVIVQKFYKNNRSFVQTQRDLRKDYGPHNQPSVLTIRRIVEKFETNFSLHNIKTPTRKRKARNQENINAVSASVAEDAYRSINRRSQELGLSRMTTWRIMRKDLGLYGPRKPAKLESSMEKHGGDAVCVAFSKGHLFSGGADGKLKVWDNQLNLKKTVDVHEAGIYSLVLSATGRLYTSCCDGSVKYLEDPLGSDQIEQLAKCDGTVQVMYCKEDILYTGDDKGNVTKWVNDKMLFRYNIVEEILGLVVEDNLIYTARDLAVCVSKRLAGKSGKYTNKAVFPGRAPITFLGPLVEKKGTYLAFVDRTGKGLCLIKNLPGEKFATIWENKDCHEMIINSIVGDETRLFSGGYDGKIKGWGDLSNTKPTTIGEVDIGKCINSLCFGGGAVYAACVDGTVKKATF